MNSIFVSTILALIFSSACLWYLRETDPKRRRVFGLSGWGTKRYEKEAWLLSVLPGLVLLLTQSYASFIMWFAAFSLMGWLLAVVKPTSVKHMRR